MTFTQTASKQDKVVGLAPEPLHVLLYRSHSLVPADQTDAEVARILRAARVKNATLGITGALMLYEDWFAQVLEGPEEAVRTLFTRIEGDPRHDSVEVLDRRDVATRSFDRWRMAYVGEHGEADIPMMAVGDTLAEAAAWRPSDDREALLAQLRQATRGYGRGS